MADLDEDVDLEEDVEGSCSHRSHTRAGWVEVEEVLHAHNHPYTCQGSLEDRPAPDRCVAGHCSRHSRNPAGVGHDIHLPDDVEVAAVCFRIAGEEEHAEEGVVAGKPYLRRPLSQTGYKAGQRLWSESNSRRTVLESSATSRSPTTF